MIREDIDYDAYYAATLKYLEEHEYPTFDED